MKGDYSKEDTIKQIEVGLLVEAIFLRYGYDFRKYNRQSIERSLERMLADGNHESLSAVTAKLLRDAEFFRHVLTYFSVSVTSFFRTPQFFRDLRQHILPVLRTWPHFKVWHAGCATGEEVYSMAILLQEEGLYERATIFGTDISQAALATAKAGIYALDIIRQGSGNYQQADGKASLSNYYHADHNAAAIAATLKANTTFARHNLVSDSSFGEMHLVVCRNVLIYFSEELQNEVINLFWHSLTNGGFLCLGSREHIPTCLANRFTPVCKASRIFKKRVE